jgi:hypothetical protein
MDNAAFADAQKRLTDYVGEQVVLLFPTETVWPPGTKLDPESGKPLDPWATPVSSGFTEWTGSASVGRRLANARLQSGVEFEPIGVQEGGPMQVLIPMDYYPISSGEAKYARVRGREWKVEDTELDVFRYVLQLEPR